MQKTLTISVTAFIVALFLMDMAFDAAEPRDWSNTEYTRGLK